MCYYALNSDTQHTQTIGDVDIMLNHGGSAMKINNLIHTHGEWAIAFAATKAAILFVYPHCPREFSEYENFIVSQFATFIDISQHSRIIMLDCTIHLHMAHLKNLSLNKYDRFGDLIMHHVVIGESTLLLEDNPALIQRNLSPTCLTQMLKSAKDGMLDAALPIPESTDISVLSVAKSTKRKYLEELKEL